MPNARPVAERFHEKYEIVPWSGCWIWTGATTGKGYGHMTYEQGSQRGIGAHRISWMLHKGGIGAGLYVCHRCDIPACVNPDHLFLGTSLENTTDCIAKGRARYVTRYGEATNTAKVTVESVLDIRKKAETAAVYAEKYGITQSSVRFIWRRKTWKHVP